MCLYMLVEAHAMTLFNTANVVIGVHNIPQLQWHRCWNYEDVINPGNYVSNQSSTHAPPIAITGPDQTVEGWRFNWTLVSKIQWLTVMMIFEGAADSSHIALVVALLRLEGLEQCLCDHHIFREISDFELKLMDIDREDPVPKAEYHARVRMSSAKFARICKHLSIIGDTVAISVTMEGVKFSTRGDIRTANIVCRQNTKPQEDAKGKCAPSIFSPNCVPSCIKYEKQLSNKYGSTYDAWMSQASIEFHRRINSG